MLKLIQRWLGVGKRLPNPSLIPVLPKDMMRDAGLILTDEGKADFIKEASSTAAQCLYTAFHTTRCETHIDVTFDFGKGEVFRLTFTKQDPLI
jgi:hypothetical protein